MSAVFSQEIAPETSLPTASEPSPANFWSMARNNVRLLHQSPPIQLAPRDRPLPLSFNQERLWRLAQLQPESSVHNILHSFRLVGALDITALVQSIDEIARRHAGLRTTFVIADGDDMPGQPMQQITEAIAVPLSSLDLRHLPSTDQEIAVQKQAIAQAEQPFDLSQGPLWRVMLLRLADEDYVLLRTIHHIIFDGMSHGVFVRELGALYAAFTQGEPSPLMDLPVQYADFAWTQRQWLQGDQLTRQREYWQTHFQGDVPALELPTDFSRSATTSYQGSYESRDLSPQLTEALKSLSARHGVSLFVTLLAGFNTLLYQYTGQTDLVICSPVAGRQRAESRGLIGYFNNLVALRTDLSANPSFSELLGRVSQRFMEASNYQDMPLQLVAELPNLVRTPLTRAMFVLQNTATPSLALAGLQVSSVFVDREIANFELSLSVYEKAGQLSVVLQYKTDLFKADRIVQMLEQFQTVLTAVAANPEHAIAELPRSPSLRRSPPRVPPHAALAKAAYQAPRHEVEQRLVYLWQDLLGVQPIGINDNFFDLGGHSLLTVNLIAEIEKVFGKQLPLSTLVATPTIAQLAQFLATTGSSQCWDSVVTLRAGKDNPPLFMIHDGDGETLLYRSLAHCLDPAIPVYGIQPYACDQHPILHTRIGDMVHYYIDQIRRVQPQGPYFLGGLCAGGVLAFEIARQLQLQGQSVAMVALIDAADVAAEERTGYIANQRLSSFSQALGGQAQLKAHRKMLHITNLVRKKVTNLVAYETQTRLQAWRDRAQLKTFRYCLDRQLPVPQSLQKIAVRTILVWAQQEYVPESQFAGSVLLFRATEKSPLFDQTPIDDTPYVELYEDPLLGWGQRVTQDIQVHDIPGGHSSMLQQPNVRVMANIIQSHINAVLADQEPGQRLTQEHRPREWSSQQIA